MLQHSNWWLFLKINSILHSKTFLVKERIWCKKDHINTADDFNFVSESKQLTRGTLLDSRQASASEVSRLFLIALDLYFLVFFFVFFLSLFSHALWFLLQWRKIKIFDWLIKIIEPMMFKPRIQNHKVPYLCGNLNQVNNCQSKVIYTK